jgi:hypothetical protein
MQPTNHHVTITLPDGKTAPGRVVYVQPKAERWREQRAEVHITCSEWIEPAWHPTIYNTGGELYKGKFMPYAYELGQPHNYLFKGTFERDE